MATIADRFLNSITMYRLVLWGLLGLASVSMLFGFLGLLPFSGLSMAVSAAILICASFLFNKLCAGVFRAQTNLESSLITGLILFLILTPAVNARSAGTLIIAAAIAMAGKYMLVFRKRHVFNPAALSAVVLGIAGSPIVSWWVGSKPLTAFTLIVGLAIVRKIRRFTLLWPFLISGAVMVLMTARSGLSISGSLGQALFSWPFIFFGTVMLTEPQTAPTSQKTRITFGILVGALFFLPFHFGPVFSTPELALVIGNIFAFLTGSKRKIGMRFIEKKTLSSSLYEFVFEPDATFRLEPGQFMEWTLAHPNPDNRGIRRFFTIASSPTERVVRLGVRIDQKASSYKRALLELQSNAVLSACQVAGDFLLPKDQTQKLVFLAGGIGITPFRSMVRYLVDTQQKRDAILLYACASSSDFAYMDVFERGRESFGLKTVQIVTDAAKCEPGFKCRTGTVDEKLLSEEAPDFRERMFYLSGPIAMVNAYKKLLSSLTIPSRNMKTDYFPGF